MRKSEMYKANVKLEVYGENDYEYVASFELFPNLIGCGDTQIEALNEALDNLDVYLDYCDEEGISYPSPEEKTIFDSLSGKITIRMPKTLHRDLIEYAEKDGMSLNSLVCDSIRLYLTNESIKSITEHSIEKIDSASFDLAERIQIKKPVKYEETGWEGFNNCYLNNN